MKRRLVFATPFIMVVACERSAKHEPRRYPRETHAERTPSPPSSPPAPKPRPVPEELVETLTPLSPAKTFYEMCRRAHCNPPPPGEVPETGPQEPTLVRVVAVQRETDGSRVRLERKPSMSSRWRAVVVDRLHIDLPDGACAMTDWDYHQLECTTHLSPEDLVEAGETLRVRVVPPTAPPVTTGNPPSPRAAIVARSVVGTGVRLKIARGSNDGVSTSWRVQLLDASERPVPGATCTITRVSKQWTECDVQSTIDRVAASRYVLLAPP